MFKPQKQLRSNVIKKALKAFIVPIFARRYQICAVRALWDDIDLGNEIWAKRKELEQILSDESDVVAFFSCVVRSDL